MKDFTKIQIEPIPPKIASLQKANGSLKNQNELLKTALIIGGAIAVGVIVYMIIQKLKEDEERKRRSV